MIPVTQTFHGELPAIVGVPPAASPDVWSLLWFLVTISPAFAVVVALVGIVRAASRVVDDLGDEARADGPDA